ncbi:hypothetical protein NEHOM01_1671 [Nematocida homosporus]|uniref:uncharacterized protein n=1 Tax=Nematocida homosporus TaxID=1912981 RepID=UPI002220C895|nr:uncharacterized protein NEHOM01_1671 [Nematocida homosporus]KAI5186740.1 hypothetical protein NEHOM01_1671 [Nematocida homosporus]
MSYLSRMVVISVVKRQLFIHGVYVLLIFWSGVSASSSESGLNLPDVSNTAAQIAFPSSTEITKTLNGLGFEFSDVSENIEVIPYRPTRPIEQPADLNSGPDRFNPKTNVPKYSIDCSKGSLMFKMINYTSIEQAEETLYLLREIAFIRVITVQVCAQWHGTDLHVIKIQILSRVINMFDCVVLEIAVKIEGISEMYVHTTNQFAILAEVENTAQHVNYITKCQLNIATEIDGSFWNMINFGAILWRPISTVILNDDDLCNIRLLNHLVFEKDYAISVQIYREECNIDFHFIKHSMFRCGKITITSYRQDNKITISGLEHAREWHHTIKLETSWAVFQYLCKHNPVPIHIATFVCLEFDTESAQEITAASQITTKPPACIFAHRIISKLGIREPCKEQSYYINLYTKSAYAAMGLSVHRVQFCYNPKRSDLYDTMHLFVKIGALNALPEAIKTGDVACIGQEIYKGGWKIQNPLIIQLYNPQLNNEIETYKKKYTFFCQNICYIAIKIIGSKIPNPDQVDRCLELLLLFRNINVEGLKIINVRSDSQTTTNFDGSTLRQEAAKMPKYHIQGPAILILSNVDERILYWMLGRYIFDTPTNIYILNQHFRNLAIAEVASLSSAAQLQLLTINNLAGLVEIVSDRDQSQSSGFSLFKRIKEASQTPNLLKSLNLHKLALHADTIDLSLYDKAIRKLLDYNVQLVSMPFNYYRRLMVEYYKGNPITNTTLTLYTVKLSTIETELAHHQPNSPIQSSDQVQFVKTLTLLFRDRKPVVEADIVTTVRWAACYFKNLIAFRLGNIDISENERKTIIARDYLVNDLNLLRSIQLESIVAKNRLDFLTIRPYRTSLLCMSHHSSTNFIVLPYTMISRLVINTKLLDNIVSNQHISAATRLGITRYLDLHGTAINCPVCGREFYQPQSEVDGTSPFDKFDHENNFVALCHFSCGHPVCHTCVDKLSPRNRCPICRYEQKTIDFNQLIGIPLANFAVAKDNTTRTITDSSWYRSKVEGDGFVYFYLRNQSACALSVDLRKETSYNTSEKVYVI